MGGKDLLLLIYRYLFWWRKILLHVNQEHTCKHKNVITPHSFVPTVPSDILTVLRGSVCAEQVYITVNIVNVLDWRGRPRQSNPLHNIKWKYAGFLLMDNFKINFQKRNKQTKRFMNPNLTLFIIIIVIIIIVIIVIQIIYFHCLFFDYITWILIWILLSQLWIYF